MIKKQNGYLQSGRLLDVVAYQLYFGNREIGGGGPHGNVPVKNNANCLLFQKAKYIYLYPIPQVKISSTSYTLNLEKKCNHDLYVPKC